MPIAACVLLALAQSSSSQQKEARLAFERGNQHLASGHAEAALMEFEKAHELVPLHPGVLTSMGNVLLRIGRKSESIAALRSAIDLSSPQHSIGARVNLGHALASSDQLEDATASFMAALNLVPSDVQIRRRIIASMLSLVPHAQERSTGQRIVRRPDMAAEAAALHIGIEALTNNTAIAPTDASVWLELGKLQMMHALRLQDTLLASDGTWLHSSDQSPTQLRSAHAKAAVSFARALELKPSSVETTELLAKASHQVMLGEHASLLAPLLRAMRSLQQAQPELSTTISLSDEEACGADAADASPMVRWCEAGGATAAAKDVVTESSQPAATTQRSLLAVVLPPPQSEEPLEPAPGGTAAAISLDRGGGSSGELFALFATPLFVHHVSPPEAAALNRELLPVLLELAQQKHGTERSNRGGWQSSADLFSRNRLAPALAARLRGHVFEAVSEMVRRLASAHVAAGTQRPVRLRASALHAWANVNGAGDNNVFHTHTESMIAGIYYVTDAGQESVTKTACASRAPDGALELADPRFTQHVECSLRERNMSATFNATASQAAPTGEARQLHPGRFLEHSPPVHVQAAAGTVVLFPASVYHRVHSHTMPAARVTVAFNVWLAEDSKEAGVDGVQRVLDGALLLTRAT